ncbi:M48 family metalloprotease [Cohaesibacter haloalkalitolerans]|uniref:M48 family metalloprotease n=1 Tax=Cohaesibacter haloalkalitolerans TaxID=1162980 RepID=UPI001FDF951C|nr:M48 family metalloprotease [Cohaesibacter haloalkalitolerans]
MFEGFGIKSLQKVPPTARQKQHGFLASMHRKALSALMVSLIGLQPLLLASAPADAQGRSIKLVRDAETEELIRDYARPIFEAAGLKSTNIRIHLINDSRFNAFVVDSKRMFINTGTIIDAKTPNEVIGVIAHETGHIAGGHMIRLREAMRRAQTIAAIGMLAGAGAMAAGAAAGSPDAARVGGAVAAGSPGMAQRTFLSYARTEETAADRAALRYLAKTGQSAKGMLTTFERFADQALFSSQYMDPYIQSHPLPRDRIAQVENLAKKSKFFNKTDSAALQQRHDLARAKLAAFTQDPKRVLRNYKGNDLPSLYAQAIVTYRMGNRNKAVKMIDQLLNAQPNNAYFWELKGQVYLETGQPDNAVAPLNKAVSLKPNEGILRVMLGQALISSKSNRNYSAAVTHLQRGLQHDPDLAVGYRFLAQAYENLGRRAEAEIATANGYFASGDIASAKAMAARAQKKLKRGSPEWLQADDIMSYKQPKL